jgi:hypothetical protein
MNFFNKYNNLIYKKKIINVKKMIIKANKKLNFIINLNKNEKETKK